jgi:cyanuric acid amidohydrolase
MTRQAFVHRIATGAPDDTSLLEAMIASGAIKPPGVVAILGKTEGNGCVNDFTRGYALSALSAALAPRLGIAPDAVGSRVAMVMSGGTEGGLSPHFLVFAVVPADTPRTGRKALAIGTAATSSLLPEEIGRMTQVRATAAAVRAAIARAEIADPADVHWVQVKCPLLTKERIAEGRSRGASAATADTYASMGLSRGASALGVALALGELGEGALDDAVIGDNLELWSGRASCSAGIELMNSEIVVLGNSAAWTGERIISHGVMRDAIDLPAVTGVLHDLGFAAAGQLNPDAAGRIAAVLAKAEASKSGVIRGARHIMGDDSDVQSTRHARALVGGVIAAATGFTELFVSGGAEHQGPDGGGPVAVIARRS